jgi:proton-dependent oligopeptide transporter, POT family
MKTFFGHPRGLATLFFTEMWERFSYYGMRALLLLYMVTAVDKGGLGLDEKTGGAIYGLYTMLVYLLALPGGWIADRFLGLRKSVFYGGCIIASGHICMAFDSIETFFIGLLLIVIGTGMLKPNISSLVGTLYSENESAKRDAGFSVFFMGINIGAFISPIITGFLGEKVNWHFGFAAAGLGMIIGVIQFRMTEKYLGEAGGPPMKSGDQSNKTHSSQVILGLVASCALVFVVLLLLKIVVVNPIEIARYSAFVLAGSVGAYFIYILVFGELEAAERKKIWAIAIFFVASAIFYAGYEQQGSSLNLFASRYTNMFIGKFQMPASWLQSVPPVAVIVFSPVFAFLWIWLSKRKLNPATPIKLSLGLIFMSLGYIVMMRASQIVVNGSKAMPTWLILTYVLHTFGEICLYPVGLSAVTKLAPKRIVGQMMGIWFMSLAFGNLIAGIFAGEFDAQKIAIDPHIMVDLFMQVAIAMLIGGAAVFLLYKPVRRLMGGVS